MTSSTSAADPLLAQAVTGAARNSDAGELPPFDSTHSLHAALVQLLLAARTPSAHPPHAESLANAIAAAARGSRHLWEDLGVSGRDDVSTLLRRYFEPLFLRNTADLKWKHFLFAELATVASQAHPDCTRCAHPCTALTAAGKLPSADSN